MTKDLAKRQTSAPTPSATDVRTAPLLTDDIQRACAAWDTDTATQWRLTPLRVTARLASAVVFSRIEELSLDGLLASATLLHLLGGAYFELVAPDTGEDYVHVRLPLATQGPAADAAAALPSGAILPVPQLDARHPESVGWWWWACASPEAVGPVAYDVQHFHKRFDTRSDLSDHLAFPSDDPRKQRVQVTGGRYKSWRRPVQAQSLAALTWRCVGDAGAIQRLLDDEIPSLGKHRAQGYGAISGWSVEADSHGDGSLFTAAGGFARPVPQVAARTLLDGPLDGWDESPWRGWRVPPREEYVGYRAPRWMPEHQTICLVGGER